MCPHAVVVQVLDAEEIILVPGYPSLAPAPTGCLNGIFTQIPVHNVHLVDKLFGYVVARKPAEVYPVSQHIFHIRPFRLSGTVP
ncbi:hypothetical protein SDC9_188228 [bioreactor metagenome]|uniref:Uncharacterized protein n=1 Tax=bioreactor metagenome TaxID=1076179 RepID=A0A645HPC6_9ZZZZ